MRPRARAALNPAGEGSDWVLRGSKVDAALLLLDLPSEVPFGFVGRVLPTDSAAELRMELHRIASTEALELLHAAGAVAETELATGAGSPGSRPSRLEREVESAQALGRRVAGREQELWRVGISLHGLGTQPLRAERVRAELERRFSALGFRTRRPTYEADRASRPPDLTGGDPRPPGYWHTLHTDGVAAFFPFVDEAVVEAQGVLVGLHLDDASPVVLDRWSHASYSWGLFGATGSGKSFAAALFGLRSRWRRPDLDLVFLDPLGEFGRLVEALGGVSLPLGRAGGPRLNPLDPVTTGGDRAEKAGRVSAILRALFPSLRDEEAAQLDAALSRLFRDGPTTPTFSDLLAEVERPPVREGRLVGLLEVFRTGSLASIDGPTTLDWGASPVALDLSGVAEDHLPFHLTYLLDALYTRLKARPGPKLVVVDEAHLLARHAATAEFLDRVVRHVRHFDAGLLLLSQNVDDFLHHESGRSLLRNLRATILLRLAEVSPGVRSFFGLTEAESEWLPRARLPREAGYSEGLLRLGEDHLPLALVASTPEYEFLTRRLGVAEGAESSESRA